MSDIQTLYESIYEINVYLHMKDQHAEERKLLPIPTIYDDHHYHYDHHHHHHYRHDHHQPYLIVFKAQQGFFDLDRLEVHLLCFLVSAIMMMMMMTIMMTMMTMTMTRTTMMMMTMMMK